MYAIFKFHVKRIAFKNETFYPDICEWMTSDFNKTFFF